MYELIKKNKNFNYCPECNGVVVLSKERGESVCNQCGIIVNEKFLDLSHNESRIYNKADKDKKERTGNPISPLLADLSLTTLINRNEITNPDLKRASKRDSYLSWNIRNLLIAITEIKRICGNLNLPEYVKKEVLKLYKEALKKDILKGRSILGMATACIYYICREVNIPITFQDIINEASISDKSLRRCYKILFNSLNLKPSIINPVLLIPRFINELGLDIIIEKEAINILKSYLCKNTVSGINPIGLCGGAIYLATKYRRIKVSQKRISDVIGVTEVTLRARYKELLKSQNLLYF